MKLTRTLKVICIILSATFALVGCIASSSQNPISTPVPRLTLDLLKNAEYLFPIGDKYIRLIDGVYQEREGFVTPTLQLREQPIVFADLNADGLEDAAVILEFGAGGSGHGPILAIVLNENGMPYEIADQGFQLNVSPSSTINHVPLKSSHRMYVVSGACLFLKVPCGDMRSETLADQSARNV